MPFRKTFERLVNKEMQENAGEGPAPRPESMDLHPDFKKPVPPSTPDLEAEDIEWSEKKDQPPRFSTLFGVTPPPVPREPETLPVPPRRQPARGVTLSTPILVGIMVMLFFESILLFAYTVIGLYKNVPSGIIPGMGSSVGCRCEEDPRPAINIAPNFMIPQSQNEATETVTITTSLTPSPESMTRTPTTSKPTSTSTSTSTTSSDPASQAAALVASMLGELSTSTSSPPPTTTTSTTSSSPTKSTTIITETPSQSTVRSTKLVTVNAEGSTLPSSPRSTVTSTKLVEPSSTAA